MTQCPNCWEPMSTTARICPHCGHGETIVQPPERRRNYLLWVSFILTLGLAILLVRYHG